MNRIAVLTAVTALGCGSGEAAGPADAATDAGAPSRDASSVAHADASIAPDAAPPAAVAQSVALTVTSVDTTFVTEDHFIASVEMQLSGEPFAEAMGRDLGGYTRDYSCTGSLCSPSVYVDPSLAPADDGGPVVRIDLAGYSSAIESYEYSKQPMNNLSFESGAGLSLMFGPILNPNQQTGDAGYALPDQPVSHAGTLGVRAGADGNRSRRRAYRRAVHLLRAEDPAYLRKRMLSMPFYRR